MYNTSQLYEFSFVSPRRRPRTKPRIVITIKTEHLEELDRRLRILADNWLSHANDYCSPDVTFMYPTSDLFGHTEFGYGKCGFVTTNNDETRIEIELSGGVQLYCCTLSIKLLLMALAVPMDIRQSNQTQQVDVEMRCDRFDPNGYNHAVGGYASSRMIVWLQSQGRRSENGHNVPLPGEVVRAMRQAWIAVCSAEQKKWAQECGGYITPDGRFILGCFGNACDIAIYPDHTCGEMTGLSVRFSCHNLDSADQQITLLAGLAKLCELARQDE